MNASVDTLSESHTNTARYARVVKASKKAAWDIDRDVLRGRKFDFSHKFLPDGLSMADQLMFLTETERRSLSHVQGRTYANIFGLIERYILALVLDTTRDYHFGDQVALEALVRFSEEELKHQELFRRVEAMIASGMPGGYSAVAEANDVARVVLSKSKWAVLALTCHVELFTQSHFEETFEHDASLSPLFKDIFKYHWQEECQHAILDELEWRRLDAQIGPAERDAAVTDLIDLVAAVDGIICAQAAVDCGYFLRLCDRNFSASHQQAIKDQIVRAYRWQYIVSGVKHRHFGRVLTELTTPQQMQRILTALAPIMS
jgi:hypothetical protein